MFLIDEWVKELADRLKVAFGDRLLFVGLQGSYQRGEANEDSDIDIVAVLDVLRMDDLQGYRAILSTMPESEKSCGFVSGKRELQNWPRHELFQFAHDTRPVWGSLEGLLPPVERGDVIEGLKVGASALYHAACHTYLHGEPSALRELYKGVFFALQSWCYLRCGQYISSKRAMFPLMAGVEREILAVSMDWDAYRDRVLADPEKYVGMILDWCSDILAWEF